MLTDRQIKITDIYSFANDNEIWFYLVIGKNIELQNNHTIYYNCLLLTTDCKKEIKNIGNTDYISIHTFNDNRFTVEKIK